MPRWRRFLILAAVPAMGLLLVTSALAAPPPWAEKVTVCHVAGKSGRIVELHIPQVAADAHLRHGDSLAVYGYCP